MTVAYKPQLALPLTSASKLDTVLSVVGKKTNGSGAISETSFSSTISSFAGVSSTVSGDWVSTIISCWATTGADCTGSEGTVAAGVGGGARRRWTGGGRRLALAGAIGGLDRHGPGHHP